MLKILKHFSASSILRISQPQIINAWKVHSFFSSQNNSNNKNKLNKQQNQSTSSSFLKPGMKKVDGMFIDQQKIKNKIKQIKQRKKAGQNQQKKKQQKQFMKNFEIVKQSSKVKKFRKDTNTENIMNIQDVTLDDKPTILQITSYSNDQIRIDDFAYPHSLIITPNQIFNWQITKIRECRPEHFKIIEMLTPVPTYIIVGSQKHQQLSKQCRQYLYSLKVDIDILPMFQAVSNFNTFVVDEINTIGFFVSTGSQF